MGSEMCIRDSIQGEHQKGRKALEHRQESEKAGSEAGGYQGNQKKGIPETAEGI